MAPRVAVSTQGLHAAAFHYDWLCTTARKAERLRAATKAQDLVNMDRKHGGGQAKGAKVQANREQARVKSESLDGGHYDFETTRTAPKVRCGGPRVRIPHRAAAKRA